MSKQVSDPYVSFFGSEDVSSWETCVSLSAGKLRFCWRYLEC
jgi:hypothetical protein